MENRSGKEAAIIYIIKYVPACSRSGCRPQERIRIKVGISDASKRT